MVEERVSSLLQICLLKLGHSTKAFGVISDIFELLFLFKQLLGLNVHAKEIPFETRVFGCYVLSSI